MKTLYRDSIILYINTCCNSAENMAAGSENKAMGSEHIDEDPKDLSNDSKSRYIYNWLDYDICFVLKEK